jgi:hypothetical protein
MLFNASHFASVSQDWAIDFSIWENEESAKEDYFPMTTKDISDKFEIINLGEILQYNTDNEVSSSDWIREKIKPLMLVLN